MEFLFVVFVGEFLETGDDLTGFSLWITGRFGNQNKRL